MKREKKLTKSQLFHKEYYSQKPRAIDSYTYGVHYTDSTGLKKVVPFTDEYTRNYQKIIRRMGIPMYQVSYIYRTEVKSWGNYTVLVYKEPKDKLPKRFRKRYKADRIDLPKLVCLKENSTGKVLKLRKGTFNEDLYTYISKQEYKSALIRKPFKSTKKAIKIDFARTGMSADWEAICPEETTITFREKGEEYEAEVFKVNQGIVRERRRKLKLPKKERTIKIYEDISREINYDKYRDPKFIPYKCPPIRNEGMKVSKLTRKMVKEKKRLHQLVLKSHIKNRKRKR